MTQPQTGSLERFSDGVFGVIIIFLLPEAAGFVELHFARFRSHRRRISAFA
jgi:hypothetical protein